MGWSHPDIGMRSIFDLRPNRKALQFRRENIEHRLPRNKSSSAKRNLEFITSSIIVPANLSSSLGYGDRMQSGHFGGIEIIQGRIDMPTIESSDTVRLVFERNSCFMKRRVTRMSQPTFSQTFVVVNNTIADKLHLRNRGDSLEIRMKDGFLSLASFVISVAIAFAMWIKRLDNR